MGTTSNFDTPAASSVGLTDTFPVISAATGRGATATVTQLQTALLAASNAPINTTATSLTITQATHGNKTVTINSAVPIAITLPQATGTGTKYKFVLQVVATATGHTIKVANATDAFTGVYMSPVTGTAANMAFAAVNSGTTASRSDTMTFNGTTTGGAPGMIIDIEDVATGYFAVRAIDTCVSTTTTPFSAGV
jgi:hypothetical protein